MALPMFFMAQLVTIGGIASETEAPACRLMFPSPPTKDVVVGEKPTGILVDAVASIFERAGVPLEIMPYAPWARAVALTERRRYEGLAIALRTPEREQHMTFVGPLLENEWSFFHLSGRPLSADRQAIVGVQASFANLAPIKEFLEHSEFETLKISMPRLTRMLIDGRLDMVLLTDVAMEAWVRREGYQLDKVSGMTLSVPTYMALVTDTVCAAYQAQLQTALEDWIATGERAAFYKAYSDALETAPSSAVEILNDK